MFISANNAWAMVYDNLSSLSEELADAMCRLATGGGFAPRALYTDADEVLFNATRPQILNGMKDVVNRPDLADRCIFLTLEPISDEDRLAEKELWAEFTAVQPGILGALLDGVCEGLRRLPDIELPVLPRMADFALWVTACETAFWPEGTFMAAYVGNLDDMNALLVEASTIATVLKTMVEKKDQIADATRWSWDAERNGPQWSGTATQLLAELENIADDKTKKSKGWPGNASALSGKLRRVATVLRKAQPRIDIEFDRKGKKRTRTLFLFFHAAEEEGETPSAASATSAINENNELQRTGTENATVRNVQRSVRFADGDGPADGGASEADGLAFSTKFPQAFENVSFSDFADAADGADAVSPSSSVGAKEKGWLEWGVMSGALQPQDVVAGSLEDARTALDAARLAGVEVKVVSGVLKLTASTEPPASLMARLRQNKAGIIALLTPGLMAGAPMTGRASTRSALRSPSTTAE